MSSMEVLNKEKVLTYLSDLMIVTRNGERVSLATEDKEEAKKYEQRREAYNIVKKAIESGVFDTKKGE